MKIQDFLKDDFFIIPKSYDYGLDFKNVISDHLDKFLLRLDSIENLDSEFSKETILRRQKHLIYKINEALNFYYEGKPAKVYQSINEGLNSDLKNYTEILNIRLYTLNSNFYRLRNCKENYLLPCDDFFHIPFQKRGKVKTQRFSIPGFPSLYLGTSVYVCWEELNRPNINEFQAVRLNNVQEIKVIDLSPPKFIQSSYDYYKYLMIWPLVLACSVKVRNHEDSFKPEYIIPQLLLQWVRENVEIDGIAYQTTHIDFNNTLSQGQFINIVIPVRDIKSQGLCSTLCDKFEMTNPISFQLDQCSTGAANFMYSKEDMEPLETTIRKLELIKGRAFPYSYSVFGDLERTLGYMPTKKIVNTNI